MTMPSDFLTALKSGREAALEAERNREEIDAVLLQLKKQIAEFSENKLALARTSASPSEVISPELKLMPARSLVVAPVKQGALLVWCGDAVREICEFGLGLRGYPVEIRYLRRFISVYDRESLVAELNDLLASPHVGRIFNEFLGSPPAAPANDSA